MREQFGSVLNATNAAELSPVWMEVRMLCRFIWLSIVFAAAIAQATASLAIPSTTPVGKQSNFPYHPPPPETNPYHPIGDFQVVG